MKQSQSIGSHNQQQGLPDENNEDTSSQKNDWQPHLQQPVKPAVTDDAGNLRRHDDNQAKGYSEAKPTEPQSPGAGPSPVAPAGTGKVYGENAARSTGGSPDDRPAPEDEERRRNQAAGANG